MFVGDLLEKMIKNHKIHLDQRQLRAHLMENNRDRIPWSSMELPLNASFVLGESDGFTINGVELEFLTSSNAKDKNNPLTILIERRRRDRAKTTSTRLSDGNSTRASEDDVDEIENGNEIEQRKRDRATATRSSVFSLMKQTRSRLETSKC
ncbi:hypothetical protein YC2023_109257 [Brassica napus]